MAKERKPKKGKSPSILIPLRFFRPLKMVDSNGEIIPELVPFSPDALDRLYQWHNEQTDRCNADGSDTLTSIASKLEIYAIRFSLLLALADWACGGEKKLIDVDTVERALRLAGYFRTTASKVQGIISKDALTELQLAVLSDLPDSFTTAEGVAIAGKCGMSARISTWTSRHRTFMSQSCR